MVGIADKEVYTEMARTLLLKGDPQAARTYTGKVIAEIDPNYGPARLVQARLLKGLRDLPAAGRELVSFLLLEPPDSRQSQEVLTELKKDHGLLWHTDAEAPAGMPLDIGGKIVETQGGGGDYRLWAFNRAGGDVAWRHPGQRFLQVAPDFEKGRVFYMTGNKDNPQTLDLFEVTVASGDRKKVATLTSPREVNRSLFAYADGRIYSGLWRLDLQGGKATLQVLAVQADTGKVLWEKTHETPLLRMQGLWYARGQRLFYSAAEDLWAVNGADGAVLAHQKEPSAVAPSTRLWQQEAPPDTFYYADGDQNVVAFHTEKLAPLWRGKVPGLPATTFVATSFVRDGAMYDMDEKVVYAVRLAPPEGGNLQVLWRIEPGAGRSFRQLILAGARLFIVRSDNTLVELDRVTGKAIKEYPLLWESGMAVVAGNAGYVLSTTGRAYAIKLD